MTDVFDAIVVHPRLIEDAWGAPLRPIIVTAPGKPPSLFWSDQRHIVLVSALETNVSGDFTPVVISVPDPPPVIVTGLREFNSFDAIVTRYLVLEDSAGPPLRPLLSKPIPVPPPTPPVKHKRH